MVDVYLMSFLYIAAGTSHFIVPRLFERIVPPFISWPKAAVVWSGLAEVILGVALCFPILRSWAAIGIILLLVAVFPANIYQVIHSKARLGLPLWVIILRLPIQLVLIYWAYQYI